jgi:hypothetical protein
VIQDDDGHLFELKLAGRKKSTVSGNDARIRVHQDRIVEAELPDTGGDLATCSSECVRGFLA